MIKEMVDNYCCVIFYLKTKQDIITFIKNACVDITFTKMSYTEDEIEIRTRYFYDDRGDVLIMIELINDEYKIYRRYKHENLHDVNYFNEWLTKYKTFNYSNHLRNEKLLKLI